MSDMWGSDVRISRPEPNKIDRPVQKDLGGFAFTTAGLSHNIADADMEEMFTPHYSPQGG